MKKLADKIQRVGLIGHPDKLSGTDLVARAARLVRAARREVFTDATTAACAGMHGPATSSGVPTSAGRRPLAARPVGHHPGRATQVQGILPNTRELARAVDLLLVFGGDGTLLRVAREIAGSRTPLLGVNIGSLGFLTAVPSDELARALKQVWAGEFTYESRALLAAHGRGQGHPVRCLALNDVVVSRGNVSRLIELEVEVNHELLTRYRCDGLIISSPTGSTAYSLAAGGPLVFPIAEVMTLTPICPHTLSNRPLILPLRAVLRIRVVSPKSVTLLSADGEVASELAPGDIVQIRRSRETVRLMHLAGSSFFEALRRKLHWRGATL